MPGVGPDLLASVAVLAAGAIEPRGPADWPLKSWLGLVLYLVLFLLALWGIARLAARPEAEDRAEDRDEP
jgi:hypothetical protein